MNRIWKWLFGWLMDRGNGKETKPLPLPPVMDLPATPTAETKPALTDDIDLSTVAWHGPDIRAWPINADLEAGNSGGDITLKTTLLKGKPTTGDGDVSGNTWAIVLCKDGKLHASTYEWISYSRQSRARWKAFDAAHWTSSAVQDAESGKGTVFYVAVSSFARGGRKSKVDERTPFRKVVVP